MSTEYGKRLKAAMKHAKLTQTALASRVDMGQGSLSELINKGSGSKFTVQLAAACGVDAHWLATGEGEMLPHQNLIRKADNVSVGPKITGMVPILNKVNIGMYKEIIDSEPEDIERVPSTVPTRRYTFALRVEGDSMEPKYPEGIVLIVEPDLEPLPNDCVIAVNSDNEATFKQLIKDGGEWMLKPLNPRYPIKPLGDAKIIGIIVGAFHQIIRGVP